MTKSGARDVDAYVAAAPKAAQPLLCQLRKVIKAAAPKAEEKISYGMPYYEQHGRVVYFAGYKNHVAIYMVGDAKKTYAEELKKYKTAKATIRLPIGEPLPVTLIRKVVRWRVKELESSARG